MKNHIFSENGRKKTSKPFFFNSVKKIYPKIFFDSFRSKIETLAPVPLQIFVK